MNIQDLTPVGVFFGKMIPPTKGHISAIINAATQCQKLYVVISDNKNTTERLCKENNIPVMPIELRYQWLSQEFQDLNHISILKLDETDLPEYPNGWDEWATRLGEVVPEKITMFFVGEPEYAENLPKYFPDAEVSVYDNERSNCNISATKVRQNPLENWDYIIGPARPTLAKKILITGSESCGKTTMVRYLAKLYNTSWSEEVGRFYAEQFLGGDETSFTDFDFTRISHLQVEQDFHALRTCNKICFFDTDATVTQMFSQLYLGHANPVVEAYIDPSKYDMVFLLKPDVEWVDDGMRLNGDDEKRKEIYTALKYMYEGRGFKDKIIEVSGSYNERLQTIIKHLGGIF